VPAPREQRWAEGTFRALLDSAPDAIVAVEPRGTIVLVSAQAERLFGWPRDALIGQPVDVLVPDAARTVHPGHRDRYFAHARPRPMGAGSQLAGRRRDGSEFPAEISLSAVETEDGTLVSAAVRDVTERLDAQAERERLKADAERERFATRLTQAERLESLGQLAGGVAHDFNNLLAVITNYASFVAEELERATYEPGGDRWRQVLDDVKQVRAASDRATSLTHQLLAFGRREVVQPRVLDLNDVVSGLEQILRRTLGEHVELVVRQSASPVRTTADAGQLEQVLMNLAVNARDAMPRGGTLMIETTVVDRRGTGDEARRGWASLRVRDTGAGMPLDVQDRAFEPFFTTKPRGEGSGLGLATVYGIVTQAGGRASIASVPGKGTTITVLLPATEADLSTTPALPSTTPNRGGETILVVEDEDAIREVTRRILTRNGHTVLTAAGGFDAVTLADQHEDPIHLLLTDVVMPHLQGNEVAERVAAVRPGIRVLFMSGYAHSVLTEQGTLAEGVHLVQKPFSEQELMAVVREVLDGP
jgi:hypothetical protein